MTDTLERCAKALAAEIWGPSQEAWEAHAFLAVRTVKVVLAEAAKSDSDSRGEGDAED